MAATTQALVDAPMADLEVGHGPGTRRPRVLLIGSSLAACASALAIMAALAVYLRQRSEVLTGGEPFFPEGSAVPLANANMNVFTLTMSLFSASWIVYALRRRDRGHAYLALGLTLLFGLASMVETAYLFQQTALPVRSETGVLFYAVTGGHMAMTIAGLVFLVVMGVQAFGGQLTGRDAEGMGAATFYWYATVGVYYVVWYAVYVTK